MKNHNTNKNENHGIGKRLCSVAIASAIFVTSMPTVLFDTLPSVFLSANAANKDDFTKYTDESKDMTAASDGQDDGIYTITKPEDLVKYSQYYYSFPWNHEEDILELGFGDGVSTVAAEGFIALGTEDYPFNGKIISSAGSLNKLNLPEALFDYVADTAKIVASRAENAVFSYIRISRTTNSTNEPILARHVWHNPDAPETVSDGENTVAWTGNEWLVQVETYSDGTNAAKSIDYAGIVGEIQQGAKMQLSIKDETSANIVGTSDLGRICGSMGKDTMLTVKSIGGITTSSGELPVESIVINDAYNITTSSGNIGGIVGSMDDGSVLVMGCQPAYSGAAITTANGYAGGIVGYNNGGTVKLDATALASQKYAISSVITGTAGVGGLYGYYCAKMDDPTTSAVEDELTINLNQFNITAKENNTGSSANVGGLFGELVNPANGTITVSGKVTSSGTNSNPNLSNNIVPSAGSSGEVESDVDVPSEEKIDVDDSDEASPVTESSNESTPAVVASDVESSNGSDSSEASSVPEHSETIVADSVVTVVENSNESESDEIISGAESAEDNISEEVVSDAVVANLSGSDPATSDEKVSSESKPTEETSDTENENISSETTSEDDSTTETESDTTSGEDNSGADGVVNITMVNTIMAGSGSDENGSVIMTHSSGTANNIGGIAGTYKAYSLSQTLEISDLTVTANNNASYTGNFGGGIGLIADADETAVPVYVKLANFEATVTGCGTRYFGGFVGKGDEAFVEASATKITTESGFHGGAAVGCMARGVLKLSGSNDFSEAEPSESDVDEIRDGQIVGYRDDALVYFDGAASGLSLSSKKVDNIGTWGDILVIDGTNLVKANILTENIGHTITMTAPSASITSATTFATQALAMQIAYSNNPIITNSSVAAPSTITFGDGVVLTGTGLRGLTRDNLKSASDTSCTFTGTAGTTSIVGGDNTVTLDIENIGGKPVYRHAYNGLIGIAKTVTIENLKFYGKITLDPHTEMYAGMAAATSDTSFTAKTVETASTATFTSNSGTSDVYLGRLVGNVSGNITVSGGTYSGSVSGNAKSENSCYGGVVGRINGTTSSGFSGVTISGSVSNTGANSVQKVGGLVAEIVKGTTESRMNLDGVTVTDLTVNGNATGSSGGLLGYAWYNTAVQGADVNSAEVGLTVNMTGTNSVSVTNVAETPAVKTGSAAGLVYCATGRWLVKSIAFSGFTANVDHSNTATSFGMLVNQGRNGNDGIYMLLPSGYVYTISGDPFDAHSGVFDELVAFSSSGGVTKNGQGVVSIHTKNAEGTAFVDALIMTGSGAGNTYTAQTTLGKGKSNPNTRYYYNLDTDTRATAKLSEIASDPAKRLMSWALNKYACGNIQKYFGNPFSSSIPAANYDMVGKSWYPVNVDKSLTVNGTFKFYNSELEKNIQGKTNTKYSTLSNTTQHYLMHNALFNDVNSKLTVGTITLQGNVGKANGASGALVIGTVKGTASSESGTAEVKITGGITLDGIHVHNFNPVSDAEYAPLLINQTSDFSRLTIKNVTVAGEDSYKNSNVTTLKTKNNVTGSSYYSQTAYPKIATSLIGNAGISKDSKNINISFEEIQLDGRKSGTLSSNSDLTDAYYSVESLFTKATLLNKLQYQSGGGTYNYARTEDWTSNDHTPVKVTYGSEISDSSERKENFGKEFWYYDGKTKDANGFTTGNYTLPETHTPSSGNAGATLTGDVVSWTAQYDFSGFLPYVYTKFINAATGGVDGAHQLNVNHTSASFGGCGTYNDPYIITSGDDLVNIENIINGNYSDITLASIFLPTKSENDAVVFDSTAKWEGMTGHKSYAKNGSGATSTSITYENGTESISMEQLRTYLAGAYYKIDKNIEITSSKFTGLGDISSSADTFAVFRGVIVGTGNEKITNKTGYPLIASSYGSVVKGLTIEVDSTITRLNSSSTKTFAADATASGCPFYGAVIGQVFGGDNIIDNVYVEFSENASLTVSGTAAQVIPVGGYVGVILNGGLFFRNMTDGTITGLPNELTYAGSVGTASESLIYQSTEGTQQVQKIVNGEPVVENGQPVMEEVNVRKYDLTKPNMKYLYVNPIIGRVMNGFAVTETSTYRPFEDGTRTYPDGSTVGNTSNHVTMQNGTKNYSITDINKNDTTSFEMTSITDDSTITLSSAQALFIMSLITECGLGNSSTGHYAQGTYLKPYDSYMATHLAEYSEVGKNSSTDYTGKAANDTYSGSGTDKIPYLIKHYTPSVTSGNDTIYPAFCAAGDASHYYNLVLGGSGDFDLPDGYRGLGALMFGIKITANLDGIKDNVVFIKSMKTPSDGTVKTISLNMNLYVNLSDNYPTLDGSQVIFKNGFGLINCLQSSGDATHAFQDLTIKGSVKYVLIDSTTGQHAAYNSTNTGKPNPAVGALVGVPVNGSGDLYFKNIALDAMSLSGMCYAGGYVGAMNIAAKFYFTGCSADNLQVFAGGAAGGLIGYMRNQNAKVDADFGKTVDGKAINGTFGIISIISASEAEVLSNDGAAGAGGLIGHRKSGSQATAENITLSNVTICNGSNTPTGGYIGYDPNGVAANKTVVRAGGVIGNAGQTTILNAENVAVKNLNISGKYAGGMIGYILETNSYAKFNNCSVITDIDPKCKIVCTASGGGFIGYNESPAASTIDNCSVVGYTISGSVANSTCNVGGLIGYNNHDNATVNVKNTWLAGHLLKWGKFTGGLVGQLNKGALNGYNILIKDQSSMSSTNNSTESPKNGCIVGKNNTKPIKIAGFSRQGTVEALQMVGNSTSATEEKYGTDGYVVFADYNDTASVEGSNNLFSAVKASGTTNVDAPLAGQFSEWSKSEYALVTYKRTYKNVVRNNVILNQSPIDDSGYGEPIDSTAYDESLSGEIGSTYKGDVATYVHHAGSITQVTNVSQLTGTGTDNGFYLKMESERRSPATKRGYFQANVNNNGCITVEEATNTSNAAVWHFEKDEETGKYKMYTLNGSNKLYISQSSSNTVKAELNTTGTYFSILKSSEAKPDYAFPNGFELHTSDSTYNCFSYTNLNGGYRFETHQEQSGTNRYNSVITIYALPSESDEITTAYYNSISINGTAISTTGSAGVSSRTVTDEEYDSICAPYKTAADDKTCDIYYITETKKAIVPLGITTYRAAPYVTINDKRMMDGTQFLTGDGIYNSRSDSAYSGSAIAQIITDASGTSEAKRYQAYGSIAYPLTSNDTTVTTLPELLNDQRKYLTYKAARGSTGLPTELSSLPVLIIDDISSDNTTKLVNSYLQLLTNTSYNYTELNDSVYKVRLATCTYEKSGSDYNLDTVYSSDNSTGVNLKLDTNNKVFKIGGAYDNSDKNVEQFTLIDVEYYDPSSVAYDKNNALKTADLKVAYHLYVPVFVKKMLHFHFTSAAISGTSYRMTPYQEALDEFKRITLIENLGNPITMQFSWIYDPTFSEWMDLINAGEKLNRAYAKQLEFVDQTSYGLPDGTKLVLVDANRNNPVYYAEKTTSNLITNDASRAITCLNLDKFTQSDNTTAFTPLQFNDFFDVLTTPADGYTPTTTYFVATDNEAEATIKTNAGTYYMPSTSDVSGATLLYIKYKDGMVNEENQIEEKYYLTFFTPEPTNDTPVYHLEFNGPQTFGGTEYPSNASNRISTHIFTGDIFENDCTITPTNTSSQEMSAKSNNWIGATMTSNIGLKPGSNKGDIVITYIRYDSVGIYQSFLLQLNQSYYTDKEMNNLTSEKGIAEGSDPLVNVSAYTVDGDELNTIQASQPLVNTLSQMSGSNALIDANYLEMRSNVNLKQYLYDAYTAYQNGSADNTKFPVSATVKLAYADDDSIQAQFPENNDPTSKKGAYIGTNIIGSSNISSQAATAEYSKTSFPGSDGTKYYRKVTKKASLSYYSADTETVVVTPASDNTPEVTIQKILLENKYAQFGINAIDPVRNTDDTSVLPMKTQADYNILNLPEDAKDKIKSMKVTVSLRRKEDYEDTGKLPIEEFLVPDSLTLYQKEIGDNTFTKMESISTDTEFSYYVNCTKDDFTGNIYYIPINFSVYTGDNNNFEDTTYETDIYDEDTDTTSTEYSNRFYSNYMVKIEVELFDGENANGTRIVGSDVNNHIIYTNAKIYYDIVPNS